MSIRRLMRRFVALTSTACLRIPDLVREDST